MPPAPDSFPATARPRGAGSAWRTAALLGLVGLAAGCATAPAPETLSFLDERTGITLSVVDAPLVLARERRDLAANARDYLTLVAVTRNQSGKLASALLVHRWSTIDTRVAATAAAAAEPPLVIVADGRDIRPQPLAVLPTEFQPSAAHNLWRPAVSRVSTTAYRIDAATLRYIAQSARVSAFYDRPDDALPYMIWRDGRAALERFANTVE